MSLRTTGLRRAFAGATLAAALAALPSPAARAQDEPARGSSASGPPLWEAGVFGGVATQPAYPGADENVDRALVLPWVVYRGPLLRIDRGALTVRALRTPRTELDVGFALSLGSNASDVQARRGMPDLGTLVEFGPRLKINLGELDGDRPAWRLDLPLRGVFDASDGLRHRGYAFEPQLVYETRRDGGWGLQASAGLVFGDRELNDTFYGVAPAFATASRPAYEARAGLIGSRAGLALSRRVGQDLRLFVFARVDSVAGGANDASPLVRRETGATAGVGLAWTLARSQRRGSD